MELGDCVVESIDLSYHSLGIRDLGIETGSMGFVLGVATQGGEQCEGDDHSDSPSSSFNKIGSSNIGQRAHQRYSSKIGFLISRNRITICFLPHRGHASMSTNLSPPSMLLRASNYRHTPVDHEDPDEYVTGMVRVGAMRLRIKRMPNRCRITHSRLAATV